MTYGQPAAGYRFDFGAAAQIAARSARQAERKKLRRLRTIKRVLHFVGFLALWTIILGIAYLLFVAVMILLICLS